MLNFPILGYENSNHYSICFLTDKNVKNLTLRIDGQEIILTPVFETPSGYFWRGEVKIDPSTYPQYVTYQIFHKGKVISDLYQRKKWTFYVPGQDEQPKIAYGSCNGYENESKFNGDHDPYIMWEKLSDEHHKEPFSLLLMGGDQVYADSILHQGYVKDWYNLPINEKLNASAGKLIKEEIDHFYDKLYQERWKNTHIALMMSSIPSVMMWDDHDIIDGWGSHSDELQSSPVFQSIFMHARKYFELYQMRTKSNKNLISKRQCKYSLSLEYRNYHIIALDNRSERNQNQVMSESHWAGIKKELSEISLEKNLIIMSAIPVVYRDFTTAETLIDLSGIKKDLKDDLIDHWRHPNHQHERLKLIMNLLRDQKERVGKTIILSGDVHVGGLGVINDSTCKDSINQIHQIISSGLIHTPPCLAEWVGLKVLSNDHEEQINSDGSITSKMINPAGSNKYILSRNFVKMNEKKNDKIWVEWVCEENIHPNYVIG